MFEYETPLMTKDEMVKIRDEMQRYFNFLWESHLSPLLMRQIGCRIIYLNKLIREMEVQDSGKTN